MKVLVACEYSGRVRDAFLAKGHDALSCDLLPTEVEGPHYQGDIFDIIDEGWDILIAHPPCTYLAVSGMHWTYRGLRDPKLTEDAYEFVMRLANASIPKIAIENPVSILSTRWRKPDQIIQPWWFGDDASKKTCLWLKNLPALRKTTIHPPTGYTLSETPNRVIDGVGFYSEKNTKPLWGNQTPSGQNKLGPSKDRWKERSRTFQGVAEAMAEQWG